MFGTYIYRPGWNGALRNSIDGSLEPFIERRQNGMLYRPTDIAFGPDGAIYTLGWGGNFHYEKNEEGSWVFRVSHPLGGKSNPSLSTPLAKRTVAQLLEELGSEILPVRRVNAQDELVRRDVVVWDELAKAISEAELSTSQQTWAAWALGRMTGTNTKHAQTFHQWAAPQAHGQHPRVPRNLRVQAIRILASPAQRIKHDKVFLATVKTTLSDPDPRIRFEAIQAIHQANLSHAASEVVKQLSTEEDRIVFYAGWQALRDLAPLETRRL